MEGVIFFVSLRFYFSLIFSIDYCQNSQYLQGFVGSGIRQKAIDTKLNTLPDLEMKKSNKIRTESFRENTSKQKEVFTHERQQTYRFPS